MAGILSVQKIQGLATAADPTTVEISSGHDFIPGSSGVIQSQSRANVNTTWSTTSSSMVDVDGFYVDITPKFTDSILVWECTLTANINDNDGYARFRVVDSNNSDAKFNSNTYCGTMCYLAGTDEWIEAPIRARNTPGTTSAMRLQLQVQVNSGGTFSMNWSGSDHRVIQVTEYRA